MGGYPLYGTGPGGSTIPGGSETDGADSTAEVEQKVGVHLVRCGKREGGVLADVKLHLEKAEYGCTVYCDATNSVPV